MGDGLTSISIENLTAAVISLLQKPLPDMEVLPSASPSQLGELQRNASNTLGVQLAGNSNLAMSTAGISLVGEASTSIPSLAPLNPGTVPVLNSSTNLHTLSTTSLESLLRSVGIQPFQGTSTLPAGTQQSLLRSVGIQPIQGTNSLTSGTQQSLSGMLAAGNQPMQITSAVSHLPSMVGSLPTVCYTALGAGGDNQAGSQCNSVLPNAPISSEQGLMLSQVTSLPVFLTPVSTENGKASSKTVKLLPKATPINILPRPDTSSLALPQNIQLLSNQGVKLGGVVTAPDLDLNSPGVSVLNIEKAVSATGLSTILDLQALQTIVQTNAGKDTVSRPQHNLPLPLLSDMMMTPPPLPATHLMIPSQDGPTIIGSVLEHILQNSGNDGTIQLPLGGMDTEDHGAASVDMDGMEDTLELESYDALELSDTSPTKDVVTMSSDVGNNEVLDAASTSVVGDVGVLEIDDEQAEETSHLVFCLDCNKMLTLPCVVHDTDYRHIADTPMPTRARATVPDCLYLQQTSTIQLDGQMGVWCKETVSERTKFGPVECAKKHVGDPNSNLSKVHTFSPFKVYKGDDLFEVYNTESEDTSNWMIFIRLARSLLEQNCVLYQDGVDLFVITKTEIKSAEELLLWFSEDLCLNYGVSQDPSNSMIGQCHICGAYVMSRKKLQLHMRYSHPKQFRSQWTCDVCMKGYSSSSKLNNHMLSHIGVKPHRCVHCNKMFSDYSNLKAHQSIHTGEKKFQCTDCNKTFRQKAHLNSHILTHKGVKDFKCEYCERKFTRQSDCKTHMYSHTKERSFTCTICNKMFYKTQNYKKHLKVHTGERNYMCDKCFKGFHTKYHRDRHLKICKEVSGKEQAYMSLEEVAKLDNTCDVVSLTVNPHEAVREHHESTMQAHTLSDNIFT